MNKPQQCNDGRDHPATFGRIALIAFVVFVIGSGFLLVIPSVTAAAITKSTTSITVVFSISPLTKISSTKYYNIQTVTVTNLATGKPIANAQVTLLEDCGCHGGYAHGHTITSGMFSHKDTYGGPGNYREWARVTYNGQTVNSPIIVVKVP